MGNSDSSIEKKQYVDKFWSLEEDEIVDIRKKYKVIQVDWLNKELVDYEMFGDNYFDNNPGKKIVIHDMLEYYFTSKDKPIYKKTDYLCNKKEKICICNTHAEDFRKIYDRLNYKPGDKYISWIRKIDEPF